MSLYVGGRRAVSNVGTHSFVKENLAREWIGNSISFINLTETDLNSLTVIRPYAFTDEQNATEITLPNCTYVYNNAFMNSSFVNISLPNCEYCSYNAFSGAYNARSIELPKLMSIPSYCFSNCESLQSISLPSVTSVSNYAFSYCYNLTSISIPNCTQFNAYSLSNCTGLSSIDVSNGRYFYRYCFSNCTNLKSLDFSNAYTLVYQSMSNCTGLEKVWIPSSLTNLTCNGRISPFESVNPKCVIYTDIQDENSIPSQWSQYWNNYNSNNKLTVIYSATHENFVNGTLPTYPYSLTIKAPQDTVVKITYMNIEQITNSITMKEGGVATYKIEKEGYIPYESTVVMETSDITINVDSSQFVKIPTSLDINYNNATIGDNPQILSSLIDNYNFELNSSDLSIVNGSKTNWVNTTCESHGYLIVRPSINSILSITSRISSENNWDYGGVYVDTKKYEPTWSEVRNSYNYGTGSYLMRTCGINMTPVTYTMNLEKDITYYLNFFYVKDGGSVGNDKVYFDSIVVEKEAEIDIFEQVISAQIINIDNSDVTKLPDNIFRACESLTSINLPNVTTIGYYSIAQCYSLRTLNIPNTKTISYFGLSSNGNLEMLDLPNVETIYTSGLENCTSLRKLWLSDKCTVLWPNVFKSDINLTVYTNLSTAPIGWKNGWDNVDDNNTKVNIIWGATHKDFEDA